MKDNEINIGDFVRLLAQEAGFTLEDTRAFLKAFEELVIRILLSGKKLRLSRFLLIYLKDLPSHRAWDNLHKTYYTRPPGKRIVFSPLWRLRRVITEASKKDTNDGGGVGAV